MPFNRPPAETAAALRRLLAVPLPPPPDDPDAPLVSDAQLRMLVTLHREAFEEAANAIEELLGHRSASTEQEAA